MLRTLASQPRNRSIQQFVLSGKTQKILWWGLLFALIARLVCNAAIPLTDTSEARYAETARKMLETGGGITPQHDYGIPFWAKPPLSTWLSAASMKLFGVNEFAARLPSTLIGIGTLVLIWLWCTSHRGRDFALGVCAVLAGMSLFFMSDGAVMTDTSLVFCTSLKLAAIGLAINLSIIIGVTHFDPSGRTALAKTLNAEMRPNDKLIGYGQYAQDVPIYLRLSTPLTVADDWADTGIMQKDNWRREFYLGL